MPEGERKTSKDLIREANERLRGSTSETEPSEPVLESPPVAQPDRVVSEEPRPLEYRSEQETGPVEPEVPPTAPRSTIGTWLTTGAVRIALAALVFGGWFFFTSLNDVNRDGSGAIVSAGQLDVMGLQVGDCFNDPDEVDELIFDVAAVPCSEPHDNEVFAVPPLSASFGDAYPGQEVLDEYSYEVCSGPMFDVYVGTAYLDSSLDVFSLTPSEESWDQDDREFVCVLYRLDFGVLTGTARDSGL